MSSRNINVISLEIHFINSEFGLEGFEVTGMRDREIIICASLMKSVTLQRFLENILSSSAPIRVIATLKP